MCFATVRNGQAVLEQAERVIEIIQKLDPQGICFEYIWPQKLTPLKHTAIRSRYTWSARCAVPLARQVFGTSGVPKGDRLAHTVDFTVQLSIEE